MKPEDPANLQVGAWAALASRVPGARLGTAGAGGPLTRSVTRSTRSSTLTHTRTHTRPLGHASEPIGSFSYGTLLSYLFPEALPGHTLAGTLYTLTPVFPPAHCHTHTRSAGQVNYTLHTVTRMRPLRVTLIQIHTCYSEGHAPMLTVGLWTYVYYYTHAATCPLLPR